MDKCHGCCDARFLRRLLLALLLLAAMVAWSRYFLALSGQHFRWERMCAVTCPPFLSQQEREYIRHASAWEKPLALSLMPWGCALAVVVRRLRKKPTADVVN